MRVPLSVLAPTAALALLVFPAGSLAQTGAEVHEGQTLAGELR